jgi:hypothetical protein
MDAIASNNNEMLKYILSGKSSLANELLPNAETPLMYAVKTSNHDIVKTLLSYNSNPHIRSGANYEPPIFHVCRDCSKFEIAQLLLQYNPGVDVKDTTNKNTPLHECCIYGNSKVAMLLLENNANVTLINSNRETPLHLALKYNKVSMDVILSIIHHGGTLYLPKDIYDKMPFNYLDEGNYTPQSVKEIIATAKATMTNNSNMKKKNAMVMSETFTPSTPIVSRGQPESSISTQSTNSSLFYAKLSTPPQKSISEGVPDRSTKIHRVNSPLPSQSSSTFSAIGNMSETHISNDFADNTDFLVRRKRSASLTSPERTNRG